jgi:lysophospholipase L1-like esterase
VVREGEGAGCMRHAMDGFLRAIGAEQRGELGRAVRVSWYGDSVVATDAIPGRLRERLQDRLGDGGPGFVYVVPPHRFCSHDAITRSSNGLWNVHAISTTQIADGLYGPAGSTAEASDAASATIKLVAGTVTSVELYYLAQPHGGSVTLTGDGAELLHADTSGDARRADWATASAPNGFKKLELATRGQVRLFGIDLENARGAVVDNLGIVSVHVKSFAANDAAHWSDELAHRGADLVMIMIGANEAEWLSPGDRDTKDYQVHYEAVLAPIRKGRPDAACLVVSPTDQAEEHDGDYRSRPVMPLLVDAQRAAAHAQGCAFYSTYDWMGGKGAAAKWFRHGLVSSDFQHLSKKGANKLADALFDALMADYERYASK